MTKALSSSSVNAAMFWLLFYTAVWALLSKAEGWAFGIPTITLASLLTLYLNIQPWTLRLWRLPVLLGYLCRYAATGAFELARRLVADGQHGQWLCYRLQAEQPRPRLLLATCISLIPGALAAEVEADQLRFQVLDPSVDWQTRVARLDAEITALFPASPTDKD